jgi:hypothetical protein
VNRSPNNFLLPLVFADRGFFDASAVTSVAYLSRVAGASQKQPSGFGEPFPKATPSPKPQKRLAAFLRLRVWYIYPYQAELSFQEADSDAAQPAGEADSDAAQPAGWESGYVCNTRTLCNPLHFYPFFPNSENHLV